MVMVLVVVVVLWRRWSGGGGSGSRGGGGVGLWGNVKIAVDFVASCLRVIFFRSAGGTRRETGLSGFQSTRQ